MTGSSAWTIGICAIFVGRFRATLLGLTDYLGLPEGVVYLLVCHCVERVQRRFGEGRRPGMKQIEKELKKA